MRREKLLKIGAGAANVASSISGEIKEGLSGNVVSKFIILNLDDNSYMHY